MSGQPVFGLAVVALIGLAWGLWLGLPGRDRQSPDDIERAMDGSPIARRRRKKRSVNPLSWLQRKVESRPSKDRGSVGRKGFKIESPDDR
jgi:hypothetical protein